MTTSSVVVQGTVTPDGALTVDQKIAMPAGRVQITIQPLPEANAEQKDWWQQLQEARAVLEARGTGFRSQEEIETERSDLREDNGANTTNGRHPVDPYKEDIDPIGFALARTQTELIWVELHRASFEKHRDTDPTSAEREMRYLESAADTAMAHLQRLKELLLAGYAIDPNKRLPKRLNEPNSRVSAMIERLRKP